MDKLSIVSNYMLLHKIALVIENSQVIKTLISQTFDPSKEEDNLPQRDRIANKIKD